MRLNVESLNFTERGPEIPSVLQQRQRRGGREEYNERDIRLGGDGKYIFEHGASAPLSKNKFLNVK